MQWILQDFEDTHKLGEILERVGAHVSYHRVVPFVGELHPEPIITDKTQVVMYGSYSLRHYAAKHDLVPGVFVLNPFVHEAVWAEHLLNGPDSQIIIAKHLGQLDPNRLYFIRPVEDSKEIAGRVLSGSEIEYLIRTVNNLDPSEYIKGSLTPDTELMISEPVNIQTEWRTWIINNKVVTYSLYKSGSRVVYRNEIDDDALAFTEQMVALNPNYSPAYVLDICRCDLGLRILETNCINAAGFYAADLFKLVEAFENNGETNGF